jgi:hypothetical protein
MGAEADHVGLIAELLAAQLTDIVLAAAGSHVGRSGVADMGIVRPNDGLTVGTVKCQQVLQGRKHMAVAQIPRGA